MPKVHVHAQPGLQRCFENEQTQLTVWASAEPKRIAAVANRLLRKGMSA